MKVTFKWSSFDTGLLPALSGVVKTFILTVQRYEIIDENEGFTARRGIR